MTRHFLGIALLFSFSVSAQRALDLKQTEAIFLKNNLLLLAQQYNVDAAKAQIIQARLWENPYISAELNAVNPQDNKNFDIGPQGQKAFAIQQLIYLGAKKKNEVALAKTNAELAELDFTDLLRNLKFQFRQSYFSAYFNGISITALDAQITNVDSLVNAYDTQVKKGNIPLRDLVRLQSLYMTLKNDRTELINSYFEDQKTLNIFLSGDSIVPAPTQAELDSYKKESFISIDSLQQIALASRPDYLSTIKTIDAASFNLKWQKALAIPDLTLGANYDQRGGAFQNQVNVTLGIPLVLWNRNQGNIKQAKILITQSETKQQALAVQVKNEVISAYKKYLEAKTNVKFVTPSVTRNFLEVYNGVLQNFQKRNIQMLEFTDFIESYTQSVIQFNQIQKALIRAGEEINLSCGSNIF